MPAELSENDEDEDNDEDNDERRVSYESTYQFSAFNTLRRVHKDEAMVRKMDRSKWLRPYDPSEFKAIDFGIEEGDLEPLSDAYIKAGVQRFDECMKYTINQIHTEVNAPWTQHYRFCVQSRDRIIHDGPDLLFDITKKTTSLRRQAVLGYNSALTLEVCSLLPRGTAAELSKPSVYTDVVEYKNIVFDYTGSAQSDGTSWPRLSGYERAKRRAGWEGIFYNTDDGSQHLDIALLPGAKMHLRILSSWHPQDYGLDLGVVLEHIYHDFNQTGVFWTSPPHIGMRLQAISASRIMSEASQDACHVMRRAAVGLGLNKTPPARQGTSALPGSGWSGSDEKVRVRMENLRAQDYQCPLCDLDFRKLAPDLASAHRDISTSKQFPNVPARYMCTYCKNLFVDTALLRELGLTQETYQSMSLADLREVVDEQKRRVAQNKERAQQKRELPCFGCGRMYGDKGFLGYPNKCALNLIPEAEGRHTCGDCTKYFRNGGIPESREGQEEKLQARRTAVTQLIDMRTVDVDLCFACDDETGPNNRNFLRTIFAALPTAETQGKVSCNRCKHRTVARALKLYGKDLKSLDAEQAARVKAEVIDWEPI